MTTSQDTTNPIKTANPNWHSRGYIPHYDKPGLLQSLTFRLADSLPAHVVERISKQSDENRGPSRSVAIEKYLDAGHGACYLQDPRVAELVQNAFLFFDGERYRLLAWVIMPNHVHVVIEVIEGHPLSKVVFNWKSYTATMANRILGRKGTFWGIEYFDRMVRNEQHFANLVRYLHRNPVEAGLVARPEDWPFSSTGLWQERV